MNQLMALGAVEPPLNLSSVSSKTATGTGTGIDLAGYDGIGLVALDSAAASAGTNPTLDVTFEESDDNSTNWTAVPAAAFLGDGNFAQVTNAVSKQVRKFVVNDRKRYIREAHAIGGTSSPAFTFGVAFIGQKKYS